MNRRTWIGLLAVGGAVLAGGATFSTLRDLSFGAGSDIPTYRVRRGDFVRQVRAEGNLESEHATVLSAPARSRGPARIAWLAADGARVAADDVVIRFDPTESERKLRGGQTDRDATSSQRARPSESRPATQLA